MVKKTVATHVTVLSVNHLEEDEAKEFAEGHGFDSLEEQAESLESGLEEIIRERLFADADEIPIVSVNTDVYDDWDGTEVA